MNQIKKENLTLKNPSKESKLQKITDSELLLETILKSSEEEIKNYLENYKSLPKPEKDKLPKELNFILRNAKNKEELINLTIEQVESKILDRYTDIKSRISEKRKEGREVLIPGFKILAIPAKLKLFKATHDLSLKEKIKERLDIIEAEVKKIEEEAKQEEKLKEEKIKQLSQENAKSKMIPKTSSMFKNIMSKVFPKKNSKNKALEKKQAPKTSSMFKNIQ